jgi:hypothetical protein
MTTEQRLQQLIAAGASFTPYARPSETQPLAAAHILTSGELWFCALWPENEFAQHWRSFASVEDGGHYLAFKDSAGRPLFTVAPLDPDEREAAQWPRWHSDDAEARTGRRFVETLTLGVQQHIAANDPDQRPGESPKTL